MYGIKHRKEKNICDLLSPVSCKKKGNKTTTAFENVWHNFNVQKGCKCFENNFVSDWDFTIKLNLLDSNFEFMFAKL